MRKVLSAPPAERPRPTSFSPIRGAKAPRKGGAAASDVFRAIADPTRRAILERPRAGLAPVNILAAAFSQNRPAISKHLRVLNDARVVSEHRSGRERIYQIEPATLREVDDWIGRYRAMWQDNLNRLKSYLGET